MTKKTLEIKNALVRKGFRAKESDHTYFIFFVKGKKTNIFTKTSHSLKEYGDVLLSKMAHQLRLSKKELNNLIECPIGYEEYKKILRTKGEI